MLQFLRNLGCTTVGSVGATAMDLADPDRRCLVFKQAAALGANLASAVARKQECPDQQSERQAFFQRMKTLIQFRQADWPHEYQHWKQKGWL